MSDYGKYGMPPKKKGHGAKGYWIYGEGYYEQDGGVDPVPEPGYGKMPPITDPSSQMKFCRMFPDLEKFQPTREDLEPLGTAMADISELPNPVDNPPDSAIPAGFTYFGQFVDHDISLTDGLPLDSGTTAPGSVDNVRTASLDLDSLYGKGPDDPEVTFYEDDGVHLKIGTADPVPPHAAPELPNDLPRVPVNGQVPMRADIGDHRNDENLAVAQTHLSLLKFHNKVVDDASQPSDFESARKVVRQHYQSIVWDDFVSRLVDPAIFQKVKNEGRKWYIPDGVDDPTDLCMPVEFSVAAYRLGHTMVRNTYEWNRVFSTGSPFLPKATLINLFQFSEVSGNLSPSSPNGDGFPRLPANWPVDWRRMHDLGAADPVHSHDQLNFARPLNTVLAAKLGDLEEFRSVPEVALRNLAVRNLLRGAQLGLATGQDIAAKIGATVLSQAELTSGPHGGIVSDKGFDTRTPLWFYVLKEAEVQQGGQRLGDVGSTIVAETFHGLIAHSEDSIFDEPGWTPSLKPGANSYTMADMLIYVDDINPLGENPTV